MMPYSYIFAGLAWLTLLFVIYYSLARVLKHRHDLAKAQELACEDPILQSNRLPLGIDWILRSLKADKQHGVLNLTIQRFRGLGTTTFRASVLGTETIFTADEKNIQAILATQFKDFDIGPVRRGNFSPLLGNGIFTQDGGSWQHSRSMIRPQFARDQVSDLDLEEHHIQNLMHVLCPVSGQWTSQVDLQELFFRLTLDTATEFLFGYSVNSQLNDVQNLAPSKLNDLFIDEKAFAAAFDQGAATLSKRLRFKDKYWLFHPGTFTAACKTCHEFIDVFVQLALAKRTEAKRNAIDPNNKKYVFLEALAEETQDPLELRSQLLHILLAGRDTTASLLSWLFFSLARDPARYDKIRRIVLEEFGNYDSPTNITFATLKNCKYLNYCLNEALRLYPVVPLNTRQANKDTTLPRGGGKDGKSRIFIPKGMQVDYSVHVMHHRPEIWGPDVEEFKPERWEGRKAGWEFLPVSESCSVLAALCQEKADLDETHKFNGGPRICVGQQFALTEASYVTVRLLQRYDKLENLETDPVIRHKLGLTSSSGNGVKIRLRAS